MNQINSNKKYLHPSQIIVLGFVCVIVVGSLLLVLPIASATGKSVNYLDALFTSTSAVCVTGLVVIDPNTLSLFGQIVLMSLIQIGGLGFMTVATFLFMLIGKKISLRERIIIKESLNENTMSGLVRTIKKILIFTFSIEAAGAALLALRFMKDFSPARSIYYGIFHAVSAFCNAGFDIIPAGDNLSLYAGDPLVNIVIMGPVSYTNLDVYKRQ